MTRLKGASAQQAAELLRELADKIEAGEIGQWELNIEHTLVNVSSINETVYVDNGNRMIEFRCEVGP